MGGKPSVRGAPLPPGWVASVSPMIRVLLAECRYATYTSVISASSLC